MANTRRKAEIAQFHVQMSRWRSPDIIINPIGTLVHFKDGAWITAPWLPALSRAIAQLCGDPGGLVTTLSLPVHHNDAEIWNLIMLESGISALFGKKDGLWPENPPINGILNMSGMAFPLTYQPRIYIDCIPERIIHTLNKVSHKMPGTVIYWRPSDPMIETMASYGVLWRDLETQLLDFPEMQFAGQPEDIVSILSEWL